MKKSYIFGMALIALVFASCGSEKRVVSGEINQNNKRELSQTLGLDQKTPCADEANDDGSYYRALGIGSHYSMGFCREVATRDARSIMTKKMMDIKNKISNCSLYDVSLKEYTANIDIPYYANNGCESMIRTTNGYTAYITLEVAKEDVKNSIINELNTISKEIDLGIDFNEDKFVNYLNEIMDIK